MVDEREVVCVVLRFLCRFKRDGCERVRIRLWLGVHCISYHTHWRNIKINNTLDAFCRGCMFVSLTDRWYVSTPLLWIETDIMHTDVCAFM